MCRGRRRLKIPPLALTDDAPEMLLQPRLNDRVFDVPCGVNKLTNSTTISRAVGRQPVERCFSSSKGAAMCKDVRCRNVVISTPRAWSR